MLDDLKAELANQSDMLSGSDSKKSDGDPKSYPNQFPHILLESNFDYDEETYFRGGPLLLFGNKSEVRKKKPSVYASMA